MHKYVLVSFTPNFDEAPAQVSVPYELEEDRAVLVHILTKKTERTEHEQLLVDRIHARQYLAMPIDLERFTHFVQEY